MRSACIFILLLMSVTALQAQYISAAPEAFDADRLYSRANERYAAGDYDSAATLYQRIVDEGLATFEVQYNLGNAHFKQGDLGGSILAYERARRLEPHNEDLLHNLQLAKLNIHDKIDPLPESIFHRLVHGALRLLSLNGWVTLSLLSIWAALVLFALYAWGTQLRMRRIGFYGALIAVTLFALTFILSQGRARLDAQDRGAVILAPSVIVKSEPSEASTNLYILHEGLGLQVLESIGDWSRVRLPDGNVGWLRNGAIEEF